MGHPPTLKQLAITDGFNSGGTQTCSFNPSLVTGTGYDDLNRLVGISCGAGGSIWNQTFSYDQYDNLTKSSSGPGISWNPGYSSSTNHYLAPATYDSNGNVTNDTFNAYTWNEFSKMASVNQSGTGCATSGQCIIYDAFGRIAEIDSGSTYEEIWYTQAGKTGFMNGSSSLYAYWPTPGGGTDYYNGNNQYMHKDWLNSPRIMSNVATATETTDRAYAPYGESYDNFGATGIGTYTFTGDNEDIITGMYDTPNRELAASNQGRWLSPDPAGAGWNLYGYSTNPNGGTDPSGLFWVDDVDFGDPYPGELQESEGGIRGAGILSGEDCPTCFPLGGINPAQILQAIFGIGPGCSSDFGAPCSLIGNSLTPANGTPDRAAVARSLWLSYMWDLMHPNLLGRDSPPVLCYPGQCPNPNLDSIDTQATVTGVQPKTPPSSISWWQAFQACATFLPLIMSGNGGSAPPSVDQYPTGQQGTQNSNKYQVYDAQGQAQGAAAANAAGQGGAWSGCTGGAVSQ